MVGVPSALHLAAGLLAVAASAGLAIAILDGALAGPADPADSDDGPRRHPARLLGVAGAVVFAASHALSGAVIGGADLWAWMAVAGLGLLAVGAGPTPGGRGAGLLVPAAPQTPSYVAAAVGVVAVVRVLGAGRSAIGAGLGLLVLSLGHAAAPTQPLIAEWLTVAGALLLGGWLWIVARRRILARLLVAFVSSLVALAILSAVVLSTVGSAQLTSGELDRLARLADGLVADIDEWPAEAVNSAAAIAIAPSSLLNARLSPSEAAELYRVGFADQDFFLVLDSQGMRLNGHPENLGGSVELALGGDELLRTVRDGAAPQQGGLLSSGGRIVAFGAVALRPEGLLPEDPPAGLLVTGRFFDVVWAEQEAASLDVGIVGVVAETPAFTSDSVGVDGEAVLEGLDGRSRADLGVDGRGVFAASAPILDPERGTQLGQLIVTSTPEVIASVESDQTQRLFLVALAGGLVAALAAAFVTRRFVRPISELTSVARRIGGGDLTSRAEIASPDEVGVLGATFDEMVASLQAQQVDLSEAASTEARLRGRLESLTTSMSDGLIAVDGDGLVTQFNPAAEVLTGLPADDALGASLGRLMADRVAEERTAEALPGLGEIADLGLDQPCSTASAAARLRVLHRSGRRVPVAATAAPVRSPDGEVIGRVFVLRDIGREIEVERMKSEFLANVSHELRTPITPIKGYANVLARRDVGPERTQQFAGQILESTNRLERIVGMIVDFAGLDSGRVRLETEPVDIADLIDQTLDDWRTRYSDRVFGNHLNGALPPVMSDRTYLRRVLDELLDNAVKFSPEGDAIDLTARVEGQRLRLSVIDRGIGIDPNAANSLFTDFTQLDGTETRHYGGLGLGLGLVKRILDGTGASAEVDSDLGIGATVSLLLPISDDVPAGAQSTRVAPPQVPPPPP